jgi:hypothetical protein
MRREAFQPGLHWFGRSRAGDPETERRLQNEEREYYGANAVEKRNEQGWPREPLT